MGRKKHSAEQKLEIVLEYLKGDCTCAAIARKNNVDENTIRIWAERYREQGIAALEPKNHCAHYSSELKIKCVKEVIECGKSARQVAIEYNISAKSCIERWVKMYNANMELKDYDPKPEVYMAKARRNTTIDERKKIVDYCLNNNKNYKDTASTFNVSYRQVYTWVKKYETDGESGLKDNRGIHKADDELNDLERLLRENKRLKRELEEKEMLVQLLKKVKELERK